MSGSKIDSVGIKKTQDSLGKYIKKPSLTEKLLKKPPFRFLFDVFNAVIRETGYFEGLYTTEEQNIENIKTREDKMKYLQKMIDVVELTKAKTLYIRASQIVAGQEAEKTNELLQAMGEVIQKKLNWRDGVKSVVSAEASSLKKSKPVSLEKSEIKNAKSQETSKDIRKENKKSHGPKNPISEERKTHTSTKHGRSTVATKARETKNKETMQKNHAQNVEKTKSIIVIKDKTVSLENKSKRPEVEEAEPVNQMPAQSTLLENTLTQPRKIMSKNEAKSPEPTSSIATQNPGPNHQRKTDETDKILQNKPSSKNIEIPNLNATETHNIETENNQPSSTQMESSIDENQEQTVLTAQLPKTPPTESDERNHPLLESSNLVGTSSVRDVRKRESTFTCENSKENCHNNTKYQNRPRTSLRPLSGRPPSARPGAPRRRDRSVEIILQPNEQIKRSEVSVKLERFDDFEDDGENLVILESVNVFAGMDDKKASKTLAVDTDLEQQGHLVQQILETQKDLMPQHQNLSGGMHKNTELSSANSWRQSSVRKISNMRDVIQNLTKSVNPFGKLMDFIPEDIDGMQLELNMWRDLYAQSTSELKKEKSLTEAVTEPIKNQLTEIAADIMEYQELVDSSRAKILQNSEKIMNILS